jgi:hypothetical protein
VLPKVSQIIILTLSPQLFILFSEVYANIRGDRSNASRRSVCRYVSKGRRLMKNQQLVEELERSADDNKLEKAKLAEGFLGYVICSTQEAVVLPPFVAFAVRTNPGVWEYIRVHSGDLSVEQVTPADYLKCKETLFDDKWYCITHTNRALHVA